MNREQIAYERGYRVTKDGQLLNPRGKVIGNISSGYIRMSLYEGKKKSVKAHRLQAYQKYGDKLYEDGIMVRHLNGNPLDNSWDNILLGTHKDNQMDIAKEIRIKRSISAGKARIKYPKEFILKLREEYKEIKNYSKLSRKHNIEVTTIWHLINKRKVFKDA